MDDAEKLVVGKSRGRGSFAECFDAQFGPDKAAQAVIVKRCTSSDQSEVGRFINEAGHLQTLAGNPNVVRHIYGPKVDANKKHFYLLEPAAGNLNELLNTQTLDFGQSVKLVRDIASGIDSAHQKRIVHRDAHPGNILYFDQPGGYLAKVSDFGKARNFDEAMQLSSGDWHLGAPSYVYAPERFFALHLPDDFEKYVRIDIYSVGLLAYQIFQAGQNPIYSYFLPLVGDLSSYFSNNKIALSGGHLPIISDNITHQNRQKYYQDWLARRKVDLAAAMNVDIVGKYSTSQPAINSIIQKCVDPDYSKRYNNIKELIRELDNVYPGNQ